MTEALRHDYGSHPDQYAELTLPAGDGPHPVAVLLHGGFWRGTYDRRLMHPMVADLTGRGWATWNVEYRRGKFSGGGHDTVADVRAALGALGTVEAPLHPSRRVVIGHSAGGHLALLTAPVAQAALVVSLAGVADLMPAAREHIGRDAVSEFIDATPDEAPEAYAMLDPLGVLPTGTASLLVHGDADDRVPFSQSEAYLAAALEAGDDCMLLSLPGVDHMAIIDPEAVAYRTWVQELPWR